MNELRELLDNLWRTNHATAASVEKALAAALREAYSEGHVDGQAAMDEDDEEECPLDTEKAWAQSQTNHRLTEMRRS